MSDQEILNIPSTAGEGTTTIGEATTDTADSVVAPGERADQPASQDGAANELGSELTSDIGIASSSRHTNRSTRPLSAPKRRMEKLSYRAALRHGNDGMTPRRFMTLRESDQKRDSRPPPPAPDLKKEAREARAARGVRRALWIIAIATAINVGVAALQWQELHRAYSPVRQSVDTGSSVNRAALP